MMQRRAAELGLAWEDPDRGDGPAIFFGRHCCDGIRNREHWTVLLAQVAHDAITAAEPTVETLIVAWQYWAAFCIGTVIMLVLDMFVFHRNSHEPTLKESALWTVFWCGLALLFNLFIWYWAGAKHAIHFFT